MKKRVIVAKQRCIMYYACGQKELANQFPESCPLQLPGIPCVSGYQTIYGKEVKPNAKEETLGRAAVRSERKARSARTRRQDKTAQNHEEKA